MWNKRKCYENVLVGEARLAQLVEHQTFNLRVVGSSPTVGDKHKFCSMFSCLYSTAFIRANADSVEVWVQLSGKLLDTSLG